MKNVQHHDALLEQAIDIRAARTLCRDGWSCEQINAVLKNAEISVQTFTAMQTQSRELDKLQNEFGSPIDFLRVGHAEPSQSEIDFLNRGPDAAASVLRDNGWDNYAISLVVQDSMFASLDEPAAEWPDHQGIHNQSYGVNTPATAALPAYGYNHGYAPPINYPVRSTTRRISRRNRSGRRAFGQDVLALTCLAGAALALVYALL
ncbi:MAG: hypothetical protein KTR27_16400 [Leptolyngbyaceae cyanobacterium MAG.088]|nr:hypothetical protein [Leptolyngbyaceae cyanobacterium MAG.088]